MRKQFLFACVAFASLSAQAQTQYRYPWRIKPTADELEYRKSLPKQASPYANKTTATYTMPTDARVPGEFEESQAVSIAWVDNFPGPGPDVTTEYGDLWAQMTDALQKECTVWIRIKAGADSTTIKNFMTTKGTPLTNYKFHVMVGDDFWIRDYGPIGFYYGANDDIGFLDMNYYPGRDNDDLYPGLIAGVTGYLDVKTNLYAEGGNFFTDGFKNSFHSNVIESVNMTANPKHSAWTMAQTQDTIKYVWASGNVTSTPTLVCDGGTGHNDMYMKLMDENTMAIMEYPSVVTANDKTIIQNVINTVTTMKNVYGKPYRIYKVPMPTQDNGDTLKTCGAINNDARTFVNGLTVNKTYLLPSYSDGTTGNQAQTTAAINLFKDIAPGYKIVPLDSRILTVLGGAIHCVTMQIPAENPIHFWHPPVIDWQVKQSSYHLVSKIDNKSGIASAKCMWRKKGTTTWNTVNMTDSSGHHIADISGSFNYGDAVEYYLTATTNNGKTAVKPITASDGFYTFMIDWPTNITALNPDRNFLLNPLPNPSNGSFTIPASFDKEMQVTAVVTDMMGKKISTTDFGKMESGMHKLDFNLANAANGIYFVQVFADGLPVGTKRISKQ